MPILEQLIKEIKHEASTKKMANCLIEFTGLVLCAAEVDEEVTRDTVAEKVHEIMNESCKGIEPGKERFRIELLALAQFYMDTLNKAIERDRNKPAEPKD